MEQLKAEIQQWLKMVGGIAAPVVLVLGLAWGSLQADLAELKRWQSEERINTRWQEKMLRDLRRDVDILERRSRNGRN